MDPQHLSRLQEEQAKALSDTDQQISQIEKFKNDYKTLQERLKTLPDQLTHDVMVPFGKLAFMPGKLVHTNELLVLLGDNWFAERTAKQAEQIAGRRIEELDKQLKNLKAQRKLLEPRLEFTSDLQGHIKGQKDVKEIVEAFDEEKERLWDEQHRKNVRKQKEETRQASRNLKADKQETAVADKSGKSDDALWARLDALEREEAERGELESDDSDEASDEDQKKSRGKSVSWQDETEKTSDTGQSGDIDDPECDEDSDDDYGDGDDEDDGDDDMDHEVDADADATGSQMEDRVVRTIRFSHSHTDTPPVHPVGPAGDMTIDSPADIYKLYSPASILKKKRGNKETREAQIPRARGGIVLTKDVRQEAEPPKSTGFETQSSSSLKAFTGRVLETSTEIASGQDTALSDAKEKSEEPAVKNDPPKRVSKFKASRLAQQGLS